MDDIRQYYAVELAALCGLKAATVLESFATVPREHFLPPGPWQVETIDGILYESESADPQLIHHGVGVVVDAARAVICPNPVHLAGALQAADFRDGESVLHIGAGLGYYSALIAELVGPGGRVIALETDTALAALARGNLSPWPAVEVRSDALVLPPLDVVFVSAGMNTILRSWIDALRPGGRLLLPLTGALNGGFLFRFCRADDGPIAGAHTALAAEVVNFIRLPPWSGLPADGMAAAAVDAAMAGGSIAAVRRLRLDPHPPAAECWLHGEGWCLSKV